MHTSENAKRLMQLMAIADGIPDVRVLKLFFKLNCTTIQGVTIYCTAQSKISTKTQTSE